MDRLAPVNLRRAAIGLVALAFAGTCLYLSLRDFDWKSFAEQWQIIDWRWLALGIVFDVLSYAAQGVRWRLLLDGASLVQTTRAIYAGLFLNELIPLRPGEAVRAWLASRDLKVDVWSIASTMIVERLMDGFWLAVALVMALVLAPLPANVVRVSLLLIAVIAALLIVVTLFRRSRSALLTRITAGFRNRRALLISGASLAAQGLAFWAVIRATHLSLNVIAAFVVMVVVRIGTLIPAAPANVGSHQLSTVLGLSLYGVSRQAAASFSIVMFGVLTGPLLVIGFAACLSAGITWRSIRQVSGRDIAPAPAV